MISSKNQCQIVLRHLIDHGYITQVIATNYGVRRLASRIFDLKQGGVVLQVELRKDDSGTKYAYYTMSESARVLEANRAINGMSYAYGKTLKLAA